MRTEGRHDDLAAALAAVSRATISASDPWWIIGSAALCLHGVDPGVVGDVDLVMSVRDAASLLRAQGILSLPEYPTTGSGRRSSVAGRRPRRRSR